MKSVFYDKGVPTQHPHSGHRKQNLLQNIYVNIGNVFVHTNSATPLTNYCNYFARRNATVCDNDEKKIYFLTK